MSNSGVFNKKSAECKALTVELKQSLFDSHCNLSLNAWIHITQLEEIRLKAMEMSILCSLIAEDHHHGSPVPEDKWLFIVEIFYNKWWSFLNQNKIFLIYL